jgi:predicted amidohydrolase YtcJ
MLQRLSAPDLLLLNGAVHTMNAHDLTATAIAIKDGKVVAVGTDPEISDLAGLGTITEDLDGRTVVPGLIDGHNHLLASGQMLQQVQLYDCRSIAEIVDRVEARVNELQPGHWLLGRGWDESLLAEGRHPSRHDLDTVTPDNPVVLQRVWNKLVANSAALRAAGIDRNTPDPPDDQAYGGSFERDQHGEPTGLFRDRAKEMILQHVPEPKETELVDAIRVGCQTFNAAGITAVAEPGLYPAEMRVFHRAHQEHQLTVRTDMMMAGWGFGTVEEESLLMQRFQDMGVATGFGDEMLRIGGVKLMPDGGIGDRTAKMFEPFENEPENRGLWIIEPGELTRLIRAIHDLGFAIDSHTCGNEAQEVVVSAYAAAQSSSPKPWLRHRVHHAYLPTERSLELMALHHIPAVISNPFITNLGESFVISLGEERAERMMPMRTYIDRGVPLAGSSDAPVSDYNPWLGIYAATTRKTVAGRTLGASERISRQEALRSYTIGGAYAIGRERTTGSLEPGKLADLVLLEDDPLTAQPDAIKEIAPLATMVGGQWVFDRR